MTILTIDDGVVYGPEGTVFNKRSVYTFGWWHFPMPEKPLAETVTVLPAMMSFSMIWTDQFQHFVFDTLSRIAFSMEFLRMHPEVKILHNGGVSEAFFSALGFSEDRLVQARENTMYR